MRGGGYDPLPRFNGRYYINFGKQFDGAYLDEIEDVGFLYWASTQKKGVLARAGVKELLSQRLQQIQA